MDRELSQASLGWRYHSHSVPLMISSPLLCFLWKSLLLQFLLKKEWLISSQPQTVPGQNEDGQATRGNPVIYSWLQKYKLGGGFSSLKQSSPCTSAKPLGNRPSRILSYLLKHDTQSVCLNRWVVHREAQKGLIASCSRPRQAKSVSKKQICTISTYDLMIEKLIP